MNITVKTASAGLGYVGALAILASQCAPDVTRYLAGKLHGTLGGEVAAAGVMAVMLVAIVELNRAHQRRRAKLSAAERQAEDEDARQFSSEW